MESELTKTSDLDGPKNLRRQTWEWAVERISWFLVAAVLILALLGFLGPGPLGVRNVASVDGDLSVRCYAVVHYEAPTELLVYFRSSPQSKMARLTLSRSFTDETVLEGITPEPESVEMHDNEIVYNIRIHDAGERRTIVYRYRHTAFGRIAYSVGLLGGPIVRINQFVCP